MGKQLRVDLMTKGWPPVTSPHDLPGLRLRIVEDLSPGGLMCDVLDRVEAAAAQQDRPSPTNARWERRQMEGADLWWVPAETMPVVLEAMASVPSIVVCNPDFAPSINTFAVFETPFMGLDASDSGRGPVTVNALLWGPVNIVTEAERIPAIGISSYSRNVEYERYIPLGRSDWVLGESVDHHVLWSEVDPDDVALRSASEDRRLLAALWGLASGLPDERSYLPAYARRRLEREHGDRSARRGVRVMHLPDVHARAERPASGRHVSVRFPVKGHWRHARVGPGRLQRRWVYIAPHMAGPIDAPLSDPTATVKLLAPRPTRDEP